MDLLERGEAVDALTVALHHAAGGRGRVALVAGEPGIGKTALVRHFLRTQLAGARVLSAACDDLTTARPLGPFRDLAADVGSELAGLLRGGAPVDELYESLIDELKTPPRPVVLAIDDVHWGDEASLDLLSHVLRRLADLPVLVVLTFRTGLEPSHPLRPVLARARAPQAVHLDLPPLSRTAVAQLVTGDDADVLWERTRGNPFLVTEMITHDGTSVPPSVQYAVIGRMSDLEPAERTLVELVAVVPSRVEGTVLDSVRPGWEAQGIRPEQRGLLEVRGGSVAFRHAIARQAVVEALPASRRRKLHRDVLAALRGAEADPARLVHHAIGADDVPTLLQVGPDAAEAASRAGAHRQALQHYERLVPHADALPSLERAQLWAGYASELMTATRIDEATDALRRAADLFETAGDVRGHGRALSFLSALAQVRHQPDAADRMEEEAIRRLESVPPSRELAHAYGRRSGRHMTRWEFDDAVRWGRRVLEVTEQTGGEVPTALAWNMIGTSLVTRGDIEEGLECLDRSIAIAHEARAYNLVSIGHANAAESLLDSGRPDLAEPYLDRGQELADRHETDSVAGYMVGIRARLHAIRCEWDSAVTQARTVWSGGPLGGTNDISVAIPLARSLLRRGDDASGLLGLLTEVTRARREVQYFGPVTALRAEAAFLSGTEPPVRDLRHDLGIAARTGQRWLTGELSAWLWRLEADGGDGQAVAEPYELERSGDLTGAVAAWRDRGYPYEACLVMVGANHVDLVREAVDAADLMGAVPLGARLRGRLRDLGVTRIPRGPQPTTRENPAGLTDRQLEVLRHVAAGRTNAQIAEALFVSVRTVDHHVSAMLAKLGVTSRQEAAEQALELGVVPAPAPVRHPSSPPVTGR